MYLFLLGGIILGVVMFYVQKSPLNPVVVINPSPLDLSAITSKNVELIQKYDLNKPEDLLLFESESETFFFTGIDDGKLIKVNMITGEMEVILTPFNFTSHFSTVEEMSTFCNGNMYRESRCGRILGLSFRENDNTKLLIVNSYIGIYEYDLITKDLTVLAETPNLFINSVIEVSNTIYYTLSHHTFMRYQFLYAALDNGGYGSLYQVNPDNISEPILVLEGLSFPNGIGLTQDGKSLLIAETTLRSILKYDIQTGEKSIFSSNLPFFPDNVRVDTKNMKLITCGLKRNPFVEKYLYPHPEITKWFTRSPKFVHLTIAYLMMDKNGIGAEIDLEDGTVTKVIDPENKDVFPFCTTLEKIGDGEYISGSVLYDHGSRFKVL